MKLFKIFFINFLAVLILLLLGEFCVFAIKVNSLLKEGEFKSNNPLEFIQKVGKYYSITYLHYKEPPFDTKAFRIADIKNSKKGQIILFGCSFTYGAGLKDDETFSSILSDKTNRTVYNFGLNSASPREILYFLRNKRYSSELVNQPDNVEFVIYTYIQDHIKRLYYNLNEFSPLYKLKDNHLVFQKNNLLTETFLYRESKLLKYNKFTSLEEKEKLFQLYIKEINEEIKRDFSYKNKPAKFIIINYGADEEINFKKINELDNNIIVINIKDLVNINLDDVKYTISETDKHPNKKAWEKIVPSLKKKLGL